VKRTSDLKKAKRVGENLFLRHGIYYALFKKSGKQIWKSLRTRDRNIARARLDDRRRQMQLMTEMPRRQDIPPFSEAVEETIKTCRRDGMKPGTLDGVSTYTRLAGRSFLGPLKISSVRKEHIQEYLRQRYESRSGRSANLDLIHIRKVFRLALERHWRLDDPTTGLKMFAHKEKMIAVPSFEEVRKVINSLRELPLRNGSGIRASEFIELLALSGLRLKEAQSLKWGDIDWQRKVLIVRQGKGDKPRDVDLFSALHNFLHKLQKERGGASDEHIFPSSHGPIYKCRGLLLSAFKHVDVPRFSFHGLRHAWATELVKQGMDFGTIAAWMGHADGGLLVARRYGRHLRRDHFEMAAKRVKFHF